IPPTRPHSALGYLTANGFVEKLAAELYGNKGNATPALPIHRNACRPNIAKGSKLPSLLSPARCENSAGFPPPSHIEHPNRRPDDGGRNVREHRKIVNAVLAKSVRFTPKCRGAALKRDKATADSAWRERRCPVVMVLVYPRLIYLDREERGKD